MKYTNLIRLNLTCTIKFNKMKKLNELTSYTDSVDQR